MSAEKDIYDALRLDATVSGLVGTKIYPDARPINDPLPAVLYTRDDTEIVSSISGPVLYQRSTFGVACFAALRADADALADAVVAALVAAKLEVLDRSTDFEPETKTHLTILEVRHTV